MPKVNNQKTEDLTPEELSNLMKAINEDTNLLAANLIKVVLFTGMLRGELFKLKWGDIEFQRGFIHIRDAKGKIAQKIPLNSLAKALLENHPRTEGEFVFAGRNG